MLIEVSGDILLTGAHAIAHGVAPNDNFHQGLALALREQYPAMYKDFRHYCQQSHPKAGGLWVWAGAKGVRVVGLLTQDEAPTRRRASGQGDYAQREPRAEGVAGVGAGGSVREPGAAATRDRRRRTRVG